MSCVDRRTSTTLHPQWWLAFHVTLSYPASEMPFFIVELAEMS
jgi:hypothetical protein